MNQAGAAFTILFDRIATVVHTKLTISDEAIVGLPLPTKMHETQAIWDTGASGCCITTKVIHELGLEPYSKARVLTAAGEIVQNVYRVCFHLPNDISINVPVTEVPTLRDPFGALVGMSIISHGDFTISNFQGRTCLTFRMPSQERTDYTPSK